MSEQRIRIESTTNEKGGGLIRVVDADTGEELPNVTSIVISVVRNDVVMADVTYGNGVTSRRYVNEIAVSISADALPVREEGNGSAN
jgi:hypothetical protein